MKKLKLYSREELIKEVERLQLQVRKSRVSPTKKLRQELAQLEISHNMLLDSYDRLLKGRDDMTDLAIRYAPSGIFPQSEVDRVKTL